ncbi:9201_t:CDS:2, partial [Cetraspora pellucida]
TRNESECRWDPLLEHHRPILRFIDRIELKHTCWDPKDGELCLNRVKPEETLVEARSGSDVQIDRQIWFYEKLTGYLIEPGQSNENTTKGVSSSRQQDGGHGSRNPLRIGRREDREEVMGVNLDGTVFSADLGDSRKSLTLMSGPMRSQRSLKNQGKDLFSRQVVLITAAGLQGEQPLVDRIM